MGLTLISNPQGVRVSVIAALFNHEKYARQAFESVCSQTVKNWELIIWDDGSTDSSLKIAHEFEARYPEKIKVFKHPDNANLGQEATRNAAIEKSSGQLLTLLDTDDYFHPAKLEKLVPCFKDAQVGLAFGRVKFVVDETGNTIPTGITNETFGRVFEELLMDNFLCAGGVVFRKKFIDDGMRFDTRFKTCGEYPLWLEIALSNKIAFVPQTVAYWRGHDKNSGTKYSLKAKEELVDLKKSFLYVSKYLKYEQTLRRALAKARYDYAAELYRELELSKMREVCTDIFSDKNASVEQKMKATVLFSLSGAGRFPNKFLSKLKRSFFERRSVKMKTQKAHP